MQVVVLAGGLGTRMLPRTAAVPKSLLPVAGRPFVEWQLERLAACGFDRALLCVGHLGELVQDHVGDGRRFGLSASFASDGPRLLGTAGALRAALDVLDETFLVTYGDSYLPFDYAAPLRDLAVHPEALGTLSVFANRGRWDTSNAAVSGDRVVRYEKGASDPSLDHIDYGATALRRTVVAELLRDTPSALSDVQADLARRGKLRAYLATERFYEIGSPEGLAALEERLSGAVTE